MREVKCLSSAVASAGPGLTGSQLCLERPRKTKGLMFGVGSEGGVTARDGRKNSLRVLLTERSVEGFKATEEEADLDSELV